MTRPDVHNHEDSRYDGLVVIEYSNLWYAHRTLVETLMTRLDDHINRLSRYDDGLVVIEYSNLWCDVGDGPPSRLLCLGYKPSSCFTFGYPPVRLC